MVIDTFGVDLSDLELVFKALVACSELGLALQAMVTSSSSTSRKRRQRSHSSSCPGGKRRRVIKRRTLTESCTKSRKASSSSDPLPGTSGLKKTIHPGVGKKIYSSSSESCQVIEKDTAEDLQSRKEELEDVNKVIVEDLKNL